MKKILFGKFWKVLLKKSPVRITAILSVFVFTSFINPGSHAIVGQWWTEKNEATIEITVINGVYSGKIIELREPLNKEGQPKKDHRNKNPALRKRPLIGMTILYGLEYNYKEGRWEDGKIYIPKVGYEANCILTLETNNTLKVKGYLGSTLASQNQVWTRRIPS